MCKEKQLIHGKRGYLRCVQGYKKEDIWNPDETGILASLI